jgi:hypothetical protein
VNKANQENQVGRNDFNWSAHRQYLQWSRFRPMYDRRFGELLKAGIPGEYLRSDQLKNDFLDTFHSWLTRSELNTLTGLDAFAHRDFISGVTHALDDLMITFGDRLVCLENEYPYFKRMREDFPYKTIADLKSGDVLVLGMPFCWYGDVHPQTAEVLRLCFEKNIPVHVDSAWIGCTRDIHFDYDHPAIQTVSFSLSKGLGLGSHRAGVRYARQRHPGPVTITNDFAMEIQSSMAVGLRFMREFGSDFLQKKYSSEYALVCKELGLRPTKSIHTAFAEKEPGLWLPAGIRPFLRFWGDQKNEFTAPAF